MYLCVVIATYLLQMPSNGKEWLLFILFLAIVIVWIKTLAIFQIEDSFIIARNLYGYV